MSDRVNQLLSDVLANFNAQFAPSNERQQQPCDADEGENRGTRESGGLPRSVQMLSIEPILGAGEED